MRPPVAKPAPGLLYTVLLLTVIDFLQSGMVAFAAGPIMGEIGVSPEEFSLATASYAAVAIVTISKQQWLVERLGWRRYVQTALLVFMVGTGVCANSQGFTSFLAGRCIMGFGGASFMSTARTLIQLIPPSPWRFVGIKYFATGLACGIAAAPGLASLAVAQDSWRVIFVLLAAFAALSLPLATQALPTRRVARSERSESHPVVFMLLVSGCFAGLYALQRAQYDFFADATLVLTAGSLAAVALYQAIQAMRAQSRPLLSLRALKQPRYISGVALFTLCYVLLGANNVVLPQFMQRTLGYPWYRVGQAQTLGLSFALLAWFAMAWVLPRWPGAKKFFVAGFLALAGFGGLLSQLNASANLWTQILPALAGHGLFLMLVMATTAMQTFRDVQHDDAIFSHAQQLKNMVAQFGMALGVALANLTLQWRTTVHYAVLNQHFAVDDSAFLASGQRVAAAMSGVWDPSAPGVWAQLAQSLSQQASLLACLDYFWLVALVGMAGAVVMLGQRVMK